MQSTLLDHYIIKVQRIGDESYGFIAKIDGVINVSNVPIEECPMFENKFEMNKFIKKHKLNKNKNMKITGVKLKDAVGLSKVNGQDYYAVVGVYENKGEYIHFETESSTYFGKSMKAGACAWTSIEGAQKFIDTTYADEQDVEFFVVPIKENESYKWHGKPVDVEFGNCIVKTNKEKPLYWYNYEIARQQSERKDQMDYAVVPAIRITAEKQQFIIANMFGIGVHKLMAGGWPNQPHFSLPTPFYVNPKHRILEFDKIEYRNYIKKQSEWEFLNFPEEYQRKQALQRIANKIQFVDEEE